MTTIYTYNNKVLKNSSNDKWLKKYVDPYNPLGLAAYSMRLRLAQGTTFAGAGTAVCIDETNNIWDWTFGNGDAALAAKYTANIVEVLGINTHGITDFRGVFNNCSNLITLPTNVYFGDGTEFSSFAYGCTSITTIPNYDLHSATNAFHMFNGCTNVESGVLTMYNQLSALGTQITSHVDTFKNCGSNTTTGAAELAQIPASWGGTGA